MKTKDIIRSRRIELGLTMKELGDKVGVSEGTISRWESGHINNMRRDKIVRLAKALDVPVEDIMGWDELIEHEININVQAPVEDLVKNIPYYHNSEAAEIAQEIFDDKDLRALFDAARGSKPEDLKMAKDLLNRLKSTNRDG